MSQCLFCQIVEGKIPSTKVFESDDILSFKDINPLSKTHYLFIPKEHFDSLDHIPENKLGIVSEIHKAIQSVARKEGIDKSGYRVVTNVGAEGGQSVGHVHYHLLGGQQLGPNFSGL